MLVSKLLYISMSISKIFAAGREPATIRLYFVTLGYPPLPRTLVDLLNQK